MERLAWFLLLVVVLKHVFCDVRLTPCQQELSAFMGSRLSAVFVRHSRSFSADSKEFRFFYHLTYRGLQNQPYNGKII